MWKGLRAKGRAAVEAAEAYADNQIKRKDLMTVRAAALRHVRNSTDTPAAFAASSVSHPRLATSWVAYLCRRACWSDYMEEQSVANEMAGEVQTVLVRDIFDNSFRSVTLDPAWRTSTAVGLARSMYQSRDFSPMPILADALEEAGCDNPDILTHCRGTSPHVRGCWVVDLVLGKS
jgi:hypothetical protein